MTLIVSCPECHKQLPLDEGFSGSRVRCGGCSAVVNVEAPTSSEQQAASSSQAARSPTTQNAAASAASVSPRQPPSITVVCTCSNKFPVPTSKRGSKIRCPKCMELVFVPGPGGAGSGLAQINVPTGFGLPASLPSQLNAPTEQPNPYVAPRRPAPRSEQSSRAVLITAIAGTLCLVVLVGGAFGFVAIRTHLANQATAEDAGSPTVEPSDSTPTSTPVIHATDMSPEPPAAEPDSGDWESQSEYDSMPMADREDSEMRSMQDEQMQGPDTVTPSFSMESRSVPMENMEPSIEMGDSMGMQSRSVDTTPPDMSVQPRGNMRNPAAESLSSEVGLGGMNGSMRSNPGSGTNQYSPDRGLMNEGPDGRGASNMGSMSARPESGTGNPARPTGNFGPIDESGLRRIHFREGYSMALPPELTQYHRSTHRSTMTYTLSSASGLSVVISITDDGRISPNTPSTVGPTPKTTDDGKTTITPMVSRSNPYELEVIELDGMMARFATMQADLSHEDRHEMVNQLFSGAIPSDVKRQLQGKLDAKTEFKAAYMMEVMDHKRMVQVMVSQTGPQPLSPSRQWFNWLRTLKHEEKPDRSLIPPPFR